MTKTVGEHWVCATLARHNWAPALTRDGITRTDFLAVGTHLARCPAVEIQVKTASGTGSRVSWLLGGVTQVVAASQHSRRAYPSGCLRACRAPCAKARPALIRSLSHVADSGGG